MDKKFINLFWEKAPVDIYWSSTANEFSYYDNIVMKEDMDGFLGDDIVTNTVIDAHNYILREQESNLDHQNFYFSVILFMNFTNDKNDEAKMKALKHNLGEQLNEQMGVAQQIFIPLLNHEHYTLLVFNTKERHFNFYSSNRKNLQDGKTNIHNDNAYKVVKMIEEWYNNKDMLFHLPLNERESSTNDYMRRSPSKVTFEMDEDKECPIQLGL